jgi:hypothetical protein
MSSPPDFIAKIAQNFAELMKADKYDKAPPELRTLTWTQGVDVAGGVAGRDTGSPAVVNMLNNQISASLSTTPVLSTQNPTQFSVDPVIFSGNNLGGEFQIGILGYYMACDLANYGTLTQCREVQDVLENSILEVKAGSDRVIGEKGRRFFDYGGSSLNGGGFDAASLAASGRDMRKHRDIVTWLPNPRIIGPTQTLSANWSFTKASWTTNVDFLVEMGLVVLLGRRA